jgi:hypothetical protein
MSVASYRTRLDQLRRRQAECQRKVAAEQRNAGQVRASIGRLRADALRATSPSSRSSREREAEGKERALTRAEERLAGAMKDMSRVEEEIGRTLAQLEAAESRGQREQDARDKRRHDSDLRHAQALTRETERQARIVAAMPRGELVIRFADLPAKITVLFAAANPIDTNRLRLDGELRSIQERIRASDHRDSITLESRWALRPPDLLQALNEVRPHIVHFSGHGNERSIAFEGATGDAVAVDVGALVELMRVMTDNIRVVVFNICSSSDLAQEVSAHVEAAIGMDGEIDDCAAEIFSAAFYSAVGFGRSLEEAFGQARAALMLEASNAAAIPVMFVRTDCSASEIVLVRPTTDGN